MRGFRTFVTVTLALAGLGCTQLPAVPGHDGLQRVSSRYLDEVDVRPNVNFRAYRSVLIDPVSVSFHEEWLADMNTRRLTTRRLGEADARRVADDAARSLGASLEAAFRKLGLQVAQSPGPEVLRITASISGLYVNAVDAMIPLGGRYYVRDLGEAFLTLQATDAASGQLLARVVHKGYARAKSGAIRSNDVTVRYWFDRLYDQWANDCAEAITAGAAP